MNKKELRLFLDDKAAQYENPDFIPHDPIQIPHRYSKKEDIEIAAFLTATIAWGNRKSIINNATRLMEIMGNTPHEFILDYHPDNAHYFDGFVHRTFNSVDVETFIRSLQNIYLHHNGLENAFASGVVNADVQGAIANFKKTFFEIDHIARTQKHISDPQKNSAAKRINISVRLN